MKRKIRQIQNNSGATYAVADDGSWWWLDPLKGWVRMPDLPDASDSLFAEELSSEQHKPVTRR